MALAALYLLFQKRQHEIIMANPSFYMLVDYIVGLLAGSRYKDSSFGDQIRTLNNSGTVTSLQTLLRKGRYANLRNLWHGLSVSDRNSFITAAGSLPGALYLFLASNVIRVLAGQTLISTYIPSAVPDSFPLAIDELSLSAFTISASGVSVVVPLDFTLIIYATGQKVFDQNFDIIKDYFPIGSFSELTDLSMPTSIFANYTAWYGRIKADAKICVKSVLAKTDNGSIGPASSVCSVVSSGPTNGIIDFDGTFVIDFDSTFVVQ